MPVKIYGIYVAYAPTIDLRAEGLGRHLAEFLKGAQERGDIRFVIACPSWMRTSLVTLFDASGVHAGSFEIIAPEHKPVLLRAHEAYLRFKKRTKRKGRWHAFTTGIGELTARVIGRGESALVSARSVWTVVLLGILALPVLAAALILRAVAVASVMAHLLGRRLLRRAYRFTPLRRYASRAKSLADQPRQDSILVRLYRQMERAEAAMMREMIDARTDVVAWYCPAAFWPHFNEISAPRLMCVPDVVLADFPIGFSQIGGDRFLGVFKQVEKAVRGGEYFVTYSEAVKWRTLVGFYHADPDAISVIPHGANRLDDLIMVRGFADNEVATKVLCRNLFRSALVKAIGTPNAGIFGHPDLRYIFYASQFRPNKNLISLLEAYDYLLKRRYIGHKLVLTGDPRILPEVRRFIDSRNLQNDVLCLHGLSGQQLAACYRLADLSVNPSLSEGGCPFTFTESLSVGTPVVMARIPVTEEVVTDPDLQKIMLFDPYDWRDIAHRIEWGLQHSTQLLAMQNPLYEVLKQRSWRNVVDEYVAILDRISTPHPTGAAPCTQD